MKKALSIFIPLAILLTGVGFIFFFEFYLKEKIDTVPVLVASSDIEFKQEFNENNLEIKHINKDLVAEGVYRDIRTINDTRHVLGNYAAIEIKKGTQIYPELIDVYDLVPNVPEGEFIAPIPSKWIFSVPGSLRRSYIADFYVIAPEEQKLLLEQKKTTVYAGNSQTNETSESQTIEVTPNTHSSDQESEFKTDKEYSGIEPVLKSVRVAHAKDNSNREVTKSTSEKANELDATGVISELEIITTKEELNKLREYTDKGYKLYITYTFERGGN